VRALDHERPLARRTATSLVLPQASDPDGERMCTRSILGLSMANALDVNVTNMLRSQVVVVLGPSMSANVVIP